jgi:hypothetical protein
MSYAYHQLRLATQCLVHPGTLQERLAKAFTEALASLRAKDLPLACRKQFCLLSDRLALATAKGLNGAPSSTLEGLADAEAFAIAKAILHLYDFVTRYQPILGAEEAKNERFSVSLDRPRRNVRHGGTRSL